MAGSGLGAVREVMLQKYLSKWLIENAPQQPIEVGGQSIISGLLRFCNHHHAEKSDAEAQQMYRYFRVALNELTEYVEWLDKKSKESGR